MSVCNSCQNPNPFKTEAGFYKDANGERQYYEYCDRCGDVGSIYIPDVYFDAHEPVESLRDSNGQPMLFVSKRQKARYLKERGLVEAGDRLRGGDPLDSPPIQNTKSEEQTRREVKDAVAKAKRYLRYKNDAVR